jgi:hypothetical protein
MCVHMLDMVRFLLDLGWPKRISSAGGSYFNAGSTANIPDTQTATFEYDDLTLIWKHRAWGSDPDEKYPYPWGATLYGDKGSLKWSPVSAIVDALDAAFYATFSNVEPCCKPVLLALDVSGSMACSMIAGSCINARVASAAMAVITAATEPEARSSRSRLAVVGGCMAAANRASPA